MRYSMTFADTAGFFPLRISDRMSVSRRALAMIRLSQQTLFPCPIDVFENIVDKLRIIREQSDQGLPGRRRLLDFAAASLRISSTEQ